MTDRSLPPADSRDSEMRLADFVEHLFVPGHVAHKGLSGRTHYQAILKHVLTPEEVNRVFQVGADARTKLKAIPDWPYLSDVRLCDLTPDHVQALVTSAVAKGYSTQTVVHIRNVVGAIVTHAKREKCHDGDNPAAMVTLPAMTRKEEHTLTLAQAQEVLRAMRYPEKEMALIAMLTSMNVAEICGLHWKHVNLTRDPVQADGEPVPPLHIAVRREWPRGWSGDLGPNNRRNRNLPIPAPLLPVLRELSHRPKFAGPDDFVLASRTGRPVNGNTITAMRLKPIGKALQMPWLSWQVFRRTRTTLLYELGIQLLERAAAAGAD